MGNRLEGKVALITGAAAGIGLATAERFVQEGASVVLGDSHVDLLDRESARLAAAGFRARAVAMDVTRSDDVRLAVAVWCSESAARRAIRMVSLSRNSPTKITSGSCRKA